MREPFTPRERVAIAQAIEERIGNRQGQRTDKEPVAEKPQVPQGEKTREFAAKQAGFSSTTTYRQAAKVVEKGEDPAPKFFP